MPNPSGLIKKLVAVVKNAHFLSFLGNGLMAVFGFITLSILYRTLPVVDMGVYIFFMVIFGLVDITRAGFLTIAIVKFYSGTSDERQLEVAGSAWIIALVITGIAILVNIPTYFIADLIKDEGLNLFLKYFSLILVLTLPSFMANCIVQAEKRFDRVLWLRILTQGSFTLAVFTLAILGNITLNSVLLAFAIANAFASLIVIYLRWVKFYSIRNAEKATILELFHFGKYSMGTNISSSLFGFTNTFVINFLMGPAALAVYNLGVKLLQIIEIPLLSFANSIMPILTTHYNRGEHKEMMYALKKLIGIMTLALIPITVFSIIFAEPIIHLVGGDKYVDNEAPNIFRMMMVIGLLYPADRFFALALDVIHQPKINFYKLLVMLFVNILGIIIGFSIYPSLYSIAIASLFPFITAIVMTYYPLNKYLPFAFWEMFVIGRNEVVLFVKQFSRK